MSNIENVYCHIATMERKINYFKMKLIILDDDIPVDDLVSFHKQLQDLDNAVLDTIFDIRKEGKQNEKS